MSEASGDCAEGLKPRSGGDGADRFDAGEIGGGEDRAFVGIRNGNAAEASMGDRAAHERNVFHAGEAQVGNELPAAAQQAVVLLAT